VLGLLVNTTAGRLVLLALAVSVGLVAWLQPTWAVDPVRHTAESLLLDFGAGLAFTMAWPLLFLFLFYSRPRTLFRRWRWMVGSALGLMAAQGTLAYFHGPLPLVGDVNLGGDFGLDIQGETVWLSYARVTGLGLFGLWVMRINGPAAVSSPIGLAFLRSMYGLGLAVRGLIGLGRLSRHGYRLVPWLSSASKRSIDRVLGREAARLDAQLAHETEEYLEAASQATPRPSPPDTAAAQMKLPIASTTSPQSASRQVVAERPAREDQVDQSVASKASGPRPKDGWALPPPGLFHAAPLTLEVNDEHTTTARLIEQALAQHSVEVDVTEIRPGPTVTMFGLVPGWNRRGRTAPAIAKKPSDAKNVNREMAVDGGVPNNRVKVGSILAREKDLALALAAPSLRIQAPVPGEPVVGVEVPNRTASLVSIRSVMESDAYRQALANDGLPVALGQASAGESVAVDLVDMPHLLIAGATGSGKSVCLNSVIASLITHQHPSKVRLILVDPKRVELTPYNGIPHLVTPVVVEPDRVVRLLKGTIQEMLRRYRLLEEAAVRNVSAYNRSPRAKERIPYLVICIDELADLMMASAFDVEQAICRLAQLGRATGIHLVVATQRPSVDVVTGLIKANFPSRISFAVASQVDSRTILDTVGAERLLGKGDMLFLSPNAPKPRRVQGVFISEEEMESLTQHWRRQHGPSVADIQLEEQAYAAERAAAVQVTDHGGDQDALFQKAVDLAVRNRQLSTSLLQRRLRIGYPRAARLMDQLEDDGIVAPGAEPGKPRDVLYVPTDGL